MHLPVRLSYSMNPGYHPTPQTLQCDEADGLYSGFTSDSGILLRTLVTSSGRNFSLLEQFEALLASYLDNRSRDSTASPCDKAWGQPFLSASDISQGLKLGNRNCIFACPENAQLNRPFQPAPQAFS